MTCTDKVHGLWSEKYRPRKFTELIFAKNLHCDALRWLRNWTPQSKYLLICGPPGYGKTSLVHIIGKMLDYHTVEINSSCYRTAELSERILSVSDMQTVTNKRNLILVDEVENIAQDVAFVQLLLKNAARMKAPIIFTCNDKLGIPVKHFDVINVHQLSPVHVMDRVTQILRGEGVVFDLYAVLGLVEECNCDLRSILNILQVLAHDRVIISKIRVEKTVQKSDFKIIEEIPNVHTRRFEHYARCCNPRVVSLISTNYSGLDASLRSVAEIANALSMSDMLPAQYSFLPLDKVYKTNVRSMCLVPSRSFSCIHATRKDHRTYCTFVLPFFRLFKEERNNYMLINHLKAVLDYYRIEGSEWVEFVKDFAFTASTEKKKEFGYRHKEGYSMAVKRDIDVKRFLSA